MIDRMTTSPAQRYKPTHGGYPDYARTQIANGESMNSMQEKGMPLTTLFPTDAELMEQAIREEDAEEKNIPANLSTAADHGRLAADYAGPSNPIPGSDWQDTNTALALPDVYFDAVRLMNAMNQTAHDIQARSWKVSNAIRNVRIADLDRDRQAALSDLLIIYAEAKSETDLETKIRLAVNELADIIEPVIYPSQEHYYILRPVWEFIYAVRRAFKRTDG